MANIIIVDGPSRGGKSTFCQRLHKNLVGSQYVTFDKKMPEGVDLPSYYLGMITQAIAQTAQLPKEQVIIKDRYITAELVYPAVFNRKSLITSDIIYEAFKGHQVLLIILDASYEDYIERKPKENFIYTEKQFELTRKLFRKVGAKLSMSSANINYLLFDSENSEVIYKNAAKKINVWIHSRSYGKFKNPLTLR